MCGTTRVRARCGPQGHSPIALLPYLGPASSFLPPCQDSLSSPIYHLVTSRASATQEPVQTPIVNPQHSPFTTDLKAFRWSILEWWSGNYGGVAGQGRRCWVKPALGIRGKSVPSRGNKKHRIPKFGVRNRKVSVAGTAPFEGAWHLMNLEVQSALAWTVGHVVCY